MTLRYGFVKAKMTSAPRLQSKTFPHGNIAETQYHLHFSVRVENADWDIAANVGTDNAGDLLRYKLVPGFNHALVTMLRETAAGANVLTGKMELPALDFQRSDVLEGNGEWQNSDVLDGSLDKQPVASLEPLLEKAFQAQSDIYAFGRFYEEGNGIHDVHMNQGSRGRYIHTAGDDHNDHNDIWQDGALFIDANGLFIAYFAAFTNQTLPADELGNPLPGGHTV